MQIHASHTSMDTEKPSSKLELIQSNCKQYIALRGPFSPFRLEQFLSCLENVRLKYVGTCSTKMSTEILYVSFPLKGPSSLKGPESVLWRTWTSIQSFYCFGNQREEALPAEKSQKNVQVGLQRRTK